MILEKNAFLLRVDVGTAEDPNSGAGLEMSLLNGNTPAVKHLGTGRTFALGWQDIIEQAFAAGFDKEPT